MKLDSRLRTRLAPSLKLRRHKPASQGIGPISLGDARVDWKSDVSDEKPRAIGTIQKGLIKGMAWRRLRR